MVLAGLVGCKFEPDIEPLILPDAPQQPFMEFKPGEGKVQESSPEVVTPAPSFDVLRSRDAIEFCQQKEYFGDKDVGSCLKPEGESYYVWIAPDNVQLVDRNNPYLQSFRFVALNRKAKLDKIDDKVHKWPDLFLLVIEVYAAGGTCGGAIVSGSSGVGLPIALGLVGGCIASTGALGYTADGITRDAEDLAEAIISFLSLEPDAEYNFCRMEGYSDEECRDN